MSFEPKKCAELVKKLAPREKETLKHLANGLERKEIASRMGLSKNTVTFYLRVIFLRLGVNNSVEATRIAVAGGLVSIKF